MTRRVEHKEKEQEGSTEGLGTETPLMKLIDKFKSEWKTKQDNMDDKMLKVLNKVRRAFTAADIHRLQSPSLYNKILKAYLPIGPDFMFSIIGNEFTFEDVFRALFLNKLDSKFSTFKEENDLLGDKIFGEYMDQLFDLEEVTVGNQDRNALDIEKMYKAKTAEDLIKFTGKGTAQSTFAKAIELRQKERENRSEKLDKDTERVDIEELDGDVERD